MAANELVDFFHGKRPKGKPVDWQRRKKEYLNAVGSLYSTIKGDYLDQVIADKTVVIEYRPKEISEDGIGTYRVDELVLRVGQEKVVFSPKGRNILGAAGRVDVHGDIGTATFIIPRPGEPWTILGQRAPSVKLIPLDQDSFLATLKDIMRS